VIEAYLKDNVNSKTLRPDGTYRKVAAGNSALLDAQMKFVGDDILS
jgi:hypothetical protein